MEVYILLILLLLYGLLGLNDPSLEYGYSVQPTAMLHKKQQQIHHLKFWKCPISYYDNSSATFHLELLISGDINPNPRPETLINTPTNVTQFHEISYKPQWTTQSSQCSIYWYYSFIIFSIESIKLSWNTCQSTPIDHGLMDMPKWYVKYIIV